MSDARLRVPIEANADQLLAVIKTVTNQMDKLSAKINSLPTGDKQLGKLSNEYKRLYNSQQKLLDGYNKLGTESSNTAPKLEQVGNSSKSARTALTSLSLVVQDLPFGFIGIQNNLPGIIQGFGSLTASTNGKVLPALKILGQSLIGPAGLFLAFSAITSIVTELIQDYGSLGAALEALFGIQKSLTSQIREFNKEYDDFIKKQQTSTRITQDAKAAQEGQIATVQSLTKKATDLTLTQEQQKNAIDELKNIDKDYFGNLVYGKSTVEDIRKATEQYSKVLVAKSKIEAYKDEISSTQKLIEENKRLIGEQNKVVEADKKRSLQGQVSVGIGNEIVSNVISQGLAIRGNKKEQDNLSESNKNLQTRVDELKKLIDLETLVLIDNTKEFEKGAKAVKEYFEAYKPPKEYTDFFKNFSDRAKFENGVSLYDKLVGLDLTQGTNSVKKFNEILGQLQDDFPNAFTDIIVSSPKDLNDAFTQVRLTLKNQLDLLALDVVESQIDQDFAELFFEGVKKAKEYLKEIREEWKKSKKSLTDLIPASTENIIGLGPANINKALAPLYDLNNKMMKARDTMLQNFQNATSILNDVFFDPLQEQFQNLITKGRISLREFGNMVLENLKALAAKILATGIITLIGLLLTGGMSEATQLKTGLSGFQLFGRAFGAALGFSGMKSANFGGVNPGGLAMSGAVSLSLRGADLVGSINRTNTYINRIG